MKVVCVYDLYLHGRFHDFFYNDILLVANIRNTEHIDDHSLYPSYYDKDFLAQSLPDSFIDPSVIAAVELNHLSNEVDSPTKTRNHLNPANQPENSFTESSALVDEIVSNMIDDILSSISLRSIHSHFVKSDSDKDVNDSPGDNEDAHKNYIIHSCDSPDLVAKEVIHDIISNLPLSLDSKVPSHEEISQNVAQYENQKNPLFKNNICDIKQSSVCYAFIHDIILNIIDTSLALSESSSLIPVNSDIQNMLTHIQRCSEEIVNEIIESILELNAEPQNSFLSNYVHLPYNSSSDDLVVSDINISTKSEPSLEIEYTSSDVSDSSNSAAGTFSNYLNTANDSSNNDSISLLLNTGNLFYFINLILIFLL